MKLTTKLSMAALLALLALNSCGSNRAGDINDNNTTINDQKSTDPNDDNDGDGLLNGEEDANGNGIVDDGETDPNNRDTDGDGLWDGNELNIYGTDPLNPDTDNDGITDGREVYSCDEEIFDTQKVTQHFPANVNTADVPNVIDALDPYNDSDGDGRSNMGEKLKGTDGCDPNDGYPYITESCEGIRVSGAVYIPGGFDVDGDEVDETGFWFTPYPASATTQALPTADYANFKESMEEKFSILNGTSLDYTTGRVFHSNEIFAPKFIDNGTDTSNYQSSLYGMDIPIAIDAANIPECVDGNNSYAPTVPSNKQYIHVLKLLEANLADDVTIKNGLLGTDYNVPADYETKVYYLGTFREYTRDIAVLKNFEAPAFWTIRSANDISAEYVNGEILAWTDIDVGDFTFPGYSDPHAVIVRKGWTIDLTFGVGSGDATPGNEVLFRMATKYLVNNEAQDVAKK
jgi:hypothetical protein